MLARSSASSLRRARELLMQYADLPMDFADATLVALAEEVDANRVLTTDRRAFGRYRLYGQKSFRMLRR